MVKSSINGCDEIGASDEVDCTAGYNWSVGICSPFLAFTTLFVGMVIDDPILMGEAVVVVGSGGGGGVGDDGLKKEV
ncbi:Hypothetical predicted protein [Olea europaea subsp. europaea]|uniref:Uncharacterized protein n=1 Tax=Olea europaea subsp. europaea TaxID=158383 RepID=A0A8S0Q1G4_OLEEU|nr:Hypothetical predicted protein [Olea europaea subsp. europaea]